VFQHFFLSLLILSSCVPFNAVCGAFYSSVLCACISSVDISADDLTNKIRIES